MIISIDLVSAQSFGWPVAIWASIASEFSRGASIHHGQLMVSHGASCKEIQSSQYKKRSARPGGDNFLNRFASFRSGSLVGPATWHWPASQRGPRRTAFLPKGQRFGLQIYAILQQSFCLIIIIAKQTSQSKKVKKWYSGQAYLKGQICSVMITLTQT